MNAIMAKLCIMVAENVFLPHQPAIEQRQAGTGHQQDQGGAYQHPGVVARGLRVGHTLFEGGDAVRFLRCTLSRRYLDAWRDGRRQQRRNTQEKQKRADSEHGFPAHCVPPL